ncbi:hypothetical protein [Hymenobacter armeniacus]|uniref:Outer membrane protein beta-barrel domain-containing protein n=1 Tax=Hymenobacter armeniacus TaxID=2771358 RepID=A0ABR8JRG1_9BACT|nr:hypothetical protein [Hymenobacter armeniacus]MBD2721511.1 hypothetical protein [Hymenobacter armeniacus]
MFLLLAALPGRASAQRSFSLLLAGQAHGMQARFADDALVSSRLSLVPQMHRGWGVGTAVSLSPRAALQATVALTSYGLAFKTQRDYRGNRGDYANVASTRQDALEFALVARQHYYKLAHPNRLWFTSVGLDMVYIGSILGISGFSFSGSDPTQLSGPGIVGSLRVNGGNPYRVGLRAGVGHEWALSARHFVAVQALASIGLRDLQRFELRTVVWEQGRTIDPVYYENTVATRFSYVGVQAQYRFQLSKPRASTATAN